MTVRLRRKCFALVIQAASGGLSKRREAQRLQWPGCVATASVSASFLRRYSRNSETQQGEGASVGKGRPMRSHRVGMAFASSSHCLGITDACGTEAGHERDSPSPTLTEFAQRYAYLSGTDLRQRSSALAMRVSIGKAHGSTQFMSHPCCMDSPSPCVSGCNC